MEQDSKENGLKNLNPMFWWKYVMYDKAHITPNFCVIGKFSEKLLELAKENPDSCFYLLQTDMNSSITQYGNIVVKWKNSLHEDKVKGEWWSKIDYMLCSQEYIKEKMEAGLCGVCCLDTEEEFILRVKDKKPLTKVDRIDNWEFTKNILTT